MTADSPVTLNLNGYTSLPPGKIAAVVTYLEMVERPAVAPLGKPDAWTLQRIDGDHRRYRALFR